MIIIPQKFRLKKENENVYENYTRVGRDSNSIHTWFYQDEEQNWFSVKFNEDVESNKDTQQTSLKQDPNLLYHLISGRTRIAYPKGIEKTRCIKPNNIIADTNDNNLIIKDNKLIENKILKKANSQPILRKNLTENELSVPKSGSVPNIKKVKKIENEDLDFSKAGDWRFFVPLEKDEQSAGLTNEKIKQLQRNVYRKFALRDQVNGKNAQFDDEMNLKTKLFNTPELTALSTIYTQALVHYNAIVTDKNGKNDKPKQALASMFEKNKGAFRQIIQLAPELLWPVDKLFRASVPESIHNLIAKTNTNYQQAKKALSNEPEQNMKFKDLVKDLDNFFNSESFFSKDPKATVGSLHSILKDNAVELASLDEKFKPIVEIAKSVVVDCFKDEYKKDCKKHFVFFKSDTHKKVHGDKLEFDDIKNDDGKRKRTERVLESFDPKASK